jgi:hypothetical protein
MRSQLSIRKKLKELEKSANDALAEHLKRQKEDSKDEVYLRIYNKICERIWTLQWVLNINKEI